MLRTSTSDRMFTGLAARTGTLVCAASFLLLASLAAGCASPGAMKHVIEPDAFADRMNGLALVRPIVLDVRLRPAYDQGHVRGAYRVDPNDWSEETTRANGKLDLGARDAWARRIGALGIANDSPVYVYDTGKMIDAARVWFILQYFGARDVRVVNGGFKGLQPLVARGRMALTNVYPQPVAATFKLQPPDKALVRLADRATVRAAVDARDEQVLDARTPEEYTGKDLRKNPRGGHLPGAVNVSHKSLLDEHGRLRSVDELKTLFGEAGLSADEPLIAHCQSGGRASLAALAATEAGYRHVSNYYLSFGDWSADATCPVDTGGAEGAGH